MHLLDTHAHLADDQLQGELDAILARAEEVGLVGVIAIGTNFGDSQQCAALAQRHPLVYASAGIHPNECREATENHWQAVVQLLDQPRVVAVGETGLDRHWDFTPFDLQLAWFQRHLDIARQCDLPLVIHTRDCFADMIDVLGDAQRRGPLRGVMHSFTGTQDDAEALLELGMYLSFAGMVTYPKSTALREVARRVPLERLLIETDAPYLSPHPHRGQRPNEPSLVKWTCAAIAAERGVEASWLAEQTTQNACELFRLKEIPYKQP